MLKNILFISAIIFSVPLFAQNKDSTQFKSAKDYIKYKEETDPNMNRLSREGNKISIFSPVDTIQNKTCTCKHCCKQGRKERKK